MNRPMFQLTQQQLKKCRTVEMPNDWVGNDAEIVAKGRQSESRENKLPSWADPDRWCHYCGSPANTFGFFNEPVCRQCGKQHTHREKAKMTKFNNVQELAEAFKSFINQQLHENDHWTAKDIIDCRIDRMNRADARTNYGIDSHIKVIRGFGYVNDSPQ